ncbi:MAG: nucleoside hydrolase, partial [Acidimicrobiales bacterium]
VLANPGEITVVAIGPLTNVARAIQLDPSVATAVSRLVIMGGTVEVAGNITPAAEFNVWMDPEAADIVFRSGAAITMVGLDVCHQTHFDLSQVAALRGRGDLADFVADAAASWIEARELFSGESDLHLYDSLAMAAAIDPEVVETRPALVQIETGEGPAQGMTVAWTNDVLRRVLTGLEPNADVAVAVDLDRFEHLFRTRVLSPLESVPR